MDNTCILITGLIKYEYISLLIDTYINIKHKIISTWNDQDKKLLDILSDNGFTLVLNNYPINKNSANYQIRCILNGCLKAKDMGYKYIIRMRTDINCNNFKKFIEIIYDLYINKITFFYCIFYPPFKFYFLDVMIAGDINEILKMVKNEKEIYDDRYIELYLMETYIYQQENNINSYNKNINFLRYQDDINIKYNIFTKYFNLCHKICLDNNIKMFWLSKNYDIIYQANFIHNIIY
jgi:hypothetical protein